MSAVVQPEESPRAGGRVVIGEQRADERCPSRRRNCCPDATAMTLLRLLRPPCLRHLVHPVLLQSIARHPRSTMDVNTFAIQQTADKTLHVVNHETYNAPEDLRPSTVSPNPLEQFRAWFAAAQGPVREPEAMTLCTATPGGMPSARMVLLKELDARGFVFYTNYGSRKSHEIDANARAALVFYWREVHKQVRVGGRVERVSREETAAYYKTRPLGSRLGAWASQQSSVVQDGQLESQVEDVKARFGVKGDEKDADIPVPEFWGGWRVIPEYVLALRSRPRPANSSTSEIEFWAGKPSRLHDRVRYLRGGASSEESPTWKIERLSP
jgi:pyridoxamine-phosphate oxidase